MGTRGVRMLKTKKIIVAGYVSLDMMPAFPRGAASLAGLVRAGSGKRQFSREALIGFARAMKVFAGQ